MSKSFFDFKASLFDKLTEGSALERRADREQKQADMAKVAAEQDRKRRRAREARQDYARERKRSLEVESFKVGDTVHLGHGTKGGTGVKGKVHKIDGNTVHIKNDKGDVFKGPKDRVSTTEAIRYDSAGDSTGTVTGKGKRDRGAGGEVKVTYKGSETYKDGAKLPIKARDIGRLLRQARRKGTTPYYSRNLSNPRLTRDHVEHEVDEAAKPALRMGVDFKYKAPSDAEKKVMKQEKEKAAKMRSTPDTSAAGRAAQRMIDARKKTEESYDKLTPKQERDAERRLKPTRATVNRVRLRASDAEVADKVKQHQSEKGGKKGNTLKRRLRDLRLKLEGKDHTYHVSNIDYETDGDHKAKKRLPKSMKVKVPDHVHKGGEDDVKDHIDDHISNETGYLHNGYDSKKVKESVELEEGRQPFAVVDTANNNEVVATASNEAGAKSIINKADLPPMSIKDKSKLKIVKTRKKQHIGHPLAEAHSKDIVKGLTDMDGPFTVVAIKNNKVIKQEGTKLRNALPAIVKVMRKEVGRGVTISIEDRKGTIRNTFKEEVEQIDELSPVKLKKYSQRATRDREDTVRQGYDPMAGRLDPKSEKRRKKRVKGIARAARKMATAAEEVELEESNKAKFNEVLRKGKKLGDWNMMSYFLYDGNVWMLQSGRAVNQGKMEVFMKKAQSGLINSLKFEETDLAEYYGGRDPQGSHIQNYRKGKRLDTSLAGLRKRRIEQERRNAEAKAKREAEAKKTDESVEQVDELKSSTLRSYIDKSRKQNQTRVTRMADQPDHMPADKGEMHKLRKRRKGSEAAASRLDARKHNLEPKLKRDGSK